MNPMIIEKVIPTALNRCGGAGSMVDVFWFILWLVDVGFVWFCMVLLTPNYIPGMMTLEAKKQNDGVLF